MAKQINLSQLTDEELLLYYKEALEEHTYCYGAQFARKISINSLYGALSNSFFRWFDSRLSESITKTGQLTIRWVERALNKHLNKVCGTEHVKYVIYCDTDSVAGDTLVYANGQKVKISDLYDLVAKDGTFIKNEVDNYVVKPSQIINTLSYNGSDIVSKPINYVMKHKVKKRMFLIKVDGREVKVTEDHSLVVERDGNLLEVRATEVQPTDKFICINHKTSNFEIIDLGIEEIDVYDIEVEEYHTFFANDILVHNSNYITLSNFVKKFIKDTDIQKIVDKLDLYCEKELQTVIDSSFKELTELFNHREQVLVMKRENIASRGFWTAKKRYALNVYDSEGTRYQEPELKVQGLESVKSSMPRAVRGLVSDALKVILNKTESELHEFIDKARQDFYARPFEEITYTKSTNNLAKYSSSATIYQKGCPINVRGALMYNHLIKTHRLQDKYELIGEGDKIKFVYLSMPNPTGQNVIAAPYDLPTEFGLDPYLDKRLQFNKAFVAPVQAMTDAIGWNIEPISNLDSLFDD